ncbi:MAG: 3-deoxy-manno-octulosonate cytidylyltransferase [Gammaproteobacteria bacterium]
MKAIIIIPARYNSSRFPGKPLALIAGKSMLQRTYETAQKACTQLPNTAILVATDDQRICDHCEMLAMPFILTPKDCPTGTDRTWAAVQQQSKQSDIILNLQGDAPLTPPHFISALIHKLQSDATIKIATPVIQLSWQALDQMRQAKQKSPFSGTTAIIDQHDKALWFSKNIMPAIRNEEELRQQTQFSPIYRHIGLYAYRHELLATYVNLAQTPYEQYEGLEQLRLLEHGYPIHTVKVHHEEDLMTSGIDTLQDLQRADQWLRKYDEARPQPRKA